MSVAQNPRSAEWYRNTYKDVSTSGVVLAAGAGAAAIVALAASFTIFIQKITVNISTTAAQTITFRDNAGTPIIVAFIEASAAAGTVRTIDFGSKGFALTEGKQLDISGVAGPAYSYAVEGYIRQTSGVAASTIDRTI
jgi:hypothetical protein